MKTKTVILIFQSAEDAGFFLKYKDLADAQSGTVTGLYCGLMCFALKRATVQNAKRFYDDRIKAVLRARKGEA